MAAQQGPGAAQDQSPVPRPYSAHLPQVALMRLTHLIHHTDRGCQYASADYRDALVDAGMLQSMTEQEATYVPRQLLIIFR